MVDHLADGIWPEISVIQFDTASVCREPHLPDIACWAFSMLAISVPFIIFIGLVQMHLEFFLDLVEVEYPVGSWGPVKVTGTARWRQKPQFAWNELCQGEM